MKLTIAQMVSLAKGDKAAVLDMLQAEQEADRGVVSDIRLKIANAIKPKAPKYE